MGFWQGLQQASQIQREERARQEEIKLRKEERESEHKWDMDKFQMQVLEGRRNDLLKNKAERLAADQELRQQITFATNLGLSKEGAILMQSTGHLSLLFDQYEKNKKVDPNFMKSLDARLQTIAKDLPDETKSKILLAGASTDRDTTDPEQAELASYEAILSATTAEQLDEIAMTLYTPPSPVSIPSLGGIDFGYASGGSSEETKKISSELARKLRPYYQDSFIDDPVTGDIRVRQDANTDVLKLFNALEERVSGMVFTPTREYSIPGAISNVASSVETVIKKVPAKDIFENLDNILVDPEGFLSNFSGTTPVASAPVEPASRSTEEQVEDMGDALANSTFNTIVEKNNKRQ